MEVHFRSHICSKTLGKWYQIFLTQKFRFLWASLYPLELSYDGYVDNLLACASTPRFHYFRNDSVIGFLLAVSVFSYPDCPLSPPLYTKVVNLHVGETSFLILVLCVLSITHHDDRTWFILDFGYDVGLHLHLSRFPLVFLADARLGFFTCMDSKLSAMGIKVRTLTLMGVPHRC